MVTELTYNSICFNMRNYYEALITLPWIDAELVDAFIENFADKIDALSEYSVSDEDKLLALSILDRYAEHLNHFIVSQQNFIKKIKADIKQIEYLLKELENTPLSSPNVVLIALAKLGEILGVIPEGEVKQSFNTSLEEIRNKLSKIMRERFEKQIMT